MRSERVTAIQARPRREICVTVEEDGVWLYANRDGLKAIADRIAALAAADPADHPELHVKWHLGKHRSKRNPVFVLMDDKAVVSVKWWKSRDGSSERVTTLLPDLPSACPSIRQVL